MIHVVIAINVLGNVILGNCCAHDQALTSYALHPLMNKYIEHAKIWFAYLVSLRSR